MAVVLRVLVMFPLALVMLVLHRDRVLVLMFLFLRWSALSIFLEMCVLSCKRSQRQLSV